MGYICVSTSGISVEQLDQKINIKYFHAFEWQNVLYIFSTRIWAMPRGCPVKKIVRGKKIFIELQWRGPPEEGNRWEQNSL